MKQFILILSLLFFYSSCSNASADKHEDEQHHDDHEAPNSTTLSAAQIKSIQIEIGRIEKKQLTASLKANGLLMVPNNNRANATALLGGVIKDILVQTGQTVRKGQVIANVSNINFIQMQDAYISVLAQIELKELELKRQEDLKAGNAGALKNLQSAKAELKSLKSQEASLEKQFELLGIKSSSINSENLRSTFVITSPIDGAISHISVNIGSYVDANTSIAEIVDHKQLHLDLFVYEKDLQKVKVGQTIHFTLTNNPGKEYDADIYAISNTFEKNSKAIAVHALVKGDKQGLIDGMSITALVSLEHATVDAVPSDAIVNHEGHDYIFIVSEKNEEHQHHHDSAQGNVHAAHQHDSEASLGDYTNGLTFEKIPVRKGTSDIGYSEITLLKNIPADSKIVTQGAFFLMAKMTNSGEGHHH
jgi:cobalt-zinc-cadmium efflux system membrane fusion protein